MHLHKIIIKLFAEADTFTPAEFVPIFHQWIQTQALPNHLLIDVADYAHVPDGPGTLLVADEANIHMDRSGGRLNLMYVRKRPIAGAADFDGELRGVLQETLAIAAKMEVDPSLGGRLAFSKTDFVVRLNDRLLAPNTAASVAEFEPTVKTVAAEVLGKTVQATADAASPLDLLQFRVVTTG